MEVAHAQQSAVHGSCGVRVKLKPLPVSQSQQEGAMPCGSEKKVEVCHAVCNHEVAGHTPNKEPRTPKAQHPKLKP